MADSHVGPAEAHRALRLEDVLDQDEAGFPLPEVEGRVLAMLREPETDPVELESVVVRDPVLADRLLRMVNSPLYGLSQEVASIRHAIMVVGFRGLRSLSLASGITVSARQFMAVHGEDHVGLVRHVMQVAAVARELGRVATTGIHREELFVAGLLHDVGRVPLAPHLAGHGTAALHGDELVAAERRITGLDHAAVGAELCRRWNVGRAIADLVAAHHAAAAGGALAPAAAALRIADRFVHAHDDGIEKLDTLAAALADDLELVGLDRLAWRDSLAGLGDAAVTALPSLGS